MSNLNVNNITPLAGTSGTVSVSGSLLTSGNSTLGDATTDTHIFTGNITASGALSASGTIVGSKWDGDLSVSGSISASGNIIASSFDLQNIGNTNVTGSSTFGDSTLQIILFLSKISILTLLLDARIMLFNIV